MLFAMVHAAVPLHAQQFAAAPSPQSSAPSGQASSPTNEKLAQLDKRVTAAQSSADNAWNAGERGAGADDDGARAGSFYGGLVRRKNTLGIMMQSFMLMAVITVMWALVGYSLCLAAAVR